MQFYIVIINNQEYKALTMTTLALLDIFTRHNDMMKTVNHYNIDSKI